MCQLFVILEEEAQVLVTDVDVRVPAKPSVLFLRLAPATEPVAVDLVLDLIRRIIHVYARVGVRRAHLGLRALQRGEEFGVQQRRLWVPQLVRDVARQAKIRILVYRARDQAGDVGLCAEDLREGVGKGRRGLDRAKVYLADVVTDQIRRILAEISQNKTAETEEESVRVAETKRRLRLAEGDLARDFRYVLIERAAEVVVIAEYERLLELEPDSDDVPRVLKRKFVSLLHFEFMLE